MQLAAFRTSWRAKIALATLCFFGTVQAGPASDSASTTFQLPMPVLTEVLPS